MTTNINTFSYIKDVRSLIVNKIELSGTKRNRKKIQIDREAYWNLIRLLKSIWWELFNFFFNFLESFRQFQGLIWCDLICSEVMRFDVIWSGLIWFDLIWSGLIWAVVICSVLVWSDLIWLDMFCSHLIWSGRSHEWFSFDEVHNLIAFDTFCLKRLLIQVWILFIQSIRLGLD